MLSASIAALVAHKNGHAYLKLGEAAISGVTTAMGAIFILLAVGALIGTWNMAGTIPTVVYIGIEFLNAAWFYLATAAICGLVGAVTGSSWTTAGTLGVAFVGMAPVMGVSPEITAGAVISGAYFGDKMTPLSETTIMVPQLVGGLNVYQHIRAMLWTSLPAFVVALAMAQAHRAGLGVGRCAELGRTTAENFGPGLELGVHLKTDDRLKLHHRSLSIERLASSLFPSRKNYSSP